MAVATLALSSDDPYLSGSVGGWHWAPILVANVIPVPQHCLATEETDAAKKAVALWVHTAK